MEKWGRREIGNPNFLGYRKLFNNKLVYRKAGHRNRFYVAAFGDGEGLAGGRLKLVERVMDEMGRGKNYEKDE